MFLYLLISSFHTHPTGVHKQQWIPIKDNEKLHTDEVQTYTKRQVSREFSNHGNGHIILAVEGIDGTVISRANNTSTPVEDDSITIRRKKKDTDSKDSHFLPTTFSAEGHDDEEDTALHWFG